MTVPVDYLLSRGQQIKVFSVILHKAREMGFLCPDDKKIGTEGKYEGATVLDARRGAYFDVVSGLDFASLVRLSRFFLRAVLGFVSGQYKFFSGCVCI